MDIMLEKLKNDGSDVEDALERFMGREDLYIRFLHKFLEDTNFADLKESILKENYIEAFKFAHTLKGVTGNLGLTPLYSEVAILVEDLRNWESEGKGRNPEEIKEVKEMFQKVEENYKKVYTIITDTIK